VRAIQYREHGGYDRLRAVELSAPEPDNGQALVRVTYAGVSPLDDMIRARRMSSALHKPLSLIPGVGGTGVVVGETGLAEGTRVLVAGLGLGVSRDGAWREYLAAAPGDLIPIPDRVSDRQAGALDTGVGHLTAYLTLTELIDFRPGQSVLAPAVGGAVGMGTVQVARELGASLAISTASSLGQGRAGTRGGLRQRHRPVAGIAFRRRGPADREARVWTWSSTASPGRSPARPSPALPRAANMSVSDTPGAPPRRSRSPT
jgi:NADPH:quinone reductase-like Zn-dependent oxidoreductase